MDAPLRKIIHCDCDCFYAAVEMRDDPALRGRPVAVGGRPEQRGVIAACNYEARRFGVHSAMATAQALKRCPNLVLLPPAMEKYRAASRQVLAIYRDYTELVEPLALDEAYLDVSAAPPERGSATRMAQDIRERVRAAVGITVSAGVAPNKFLAKIASDWNKPDGLFVIKPRQVDAFVAALPVEKLFGVGRVTAGRLRRLGADSCGELRAWPLLELQRQFGKFGGRLYELCRGIDSRPVCPSRERKSVSVEETYARDLPDLAACLQQLPALLARLEARVARAEAAPQVRKLLVKIRFADFRQTTAEGGAAGTADADAALFRQLLEAGFARGGLPVRLLGVGVRLGAEPAEPAASQLGLFGAQAP